ncbi:MAG: hypothetical protein FJ146_19090, partial [Deltaproteobacteria bacterium]|nr:hypothetical protein [Deltaproteobacteria bacterium]
MFKFGKRSGILVFLLWCNWIGACRSWQRGSSVNETPPDTRDWKVLQQAKLSAQHKYLAAHAEEAAAFRARPLGSDGIPAMLIGILSETAPEIWAEGPAHQLMGLTFTGVESGRLPQELHLGNGSDQELKIATFSCGSCHIGRVLDSQGLTTEIFGAPNTQIDTTAFRYFLWKASNDERLTASKVTSMLHDKPLGWFYGMEHKTEELRDRQLILGNPDLFVMRIKQSLNAREALINRGLGERTYRHAKDLLRGGVPGSLDAFGFTVLSLVVGPKVRDRGALDLADDEWAILPPAPPMVDIMSVWQQSRKHYAQWDGTIKNPLMRNIGAELGVIRDPEKVDRRNAAMTTALVGDLPPAPYPFEVDMAKAARGAAIYQSVCSKCHDHNLFVDVSVLRVDANRAKGLNSPARLGLIKGL